MLAVESRNADSLVNNGYESSPDKMKDEMDFEETKESYTLSFDVPGINKKDLGIVLKGATLYVSGERKQRPCGTFKRSIPLPSDVDRENMSFIVENGVFSIVLQRIREKEKEKVPDFQTPQIINKMAKAYKAWWKQYYEDNRAYAERLERYDFD